MSAVCLRCGDFLGDPATPKGPAVAGIPLCATCVDGTVFEAHQPLPPLPPWLLWQWVRPYTAAGFVLGAAVGVQITLFFVERRASWPIVLAVVALTTTLSVTIAALFEMVGRIRVMLPSRRGPAARLKHELRSTVGLTSPLADGARLVVFSSRPPRVRDLRLPVETALLLEGAGGLVVLGRLGTRLAIPREGIASATLERARYLPPRTACALELATGRRVLLAFVDGTTFRACRDAAVALRDRLSRPGDA